MTRRARRYCVSWHEETNLLNLFTQKLPQAAWYDEHGTESSHAMNSQRSGRYIDRSASQEAV